MRGMMKAMTDVRRATAAEGWLRLKFPGAGAGGIFRSARPDRTVTPISRRMPRVELVLKRSIPLLILAFLAVIAASRCLGIVSEHTRMEDRSEEHPSELP